MRTGESGGGRVRIDWRAQLAAGSLGAAGGMGINVLSDTAGWRGVAAAVVVWAVLAATGWLRRLPPRAPLPRYTPLVLLTLALAAAVLTLVGPRAWAGAATLAAAGLVATAVLIPTDLATASRLLGGAAIIGAGVAFIGFGTAVLRGGDITPRSVADIWLGIAFIGFGTAVLRGGGAVTGWAFTCMGLGATVLGEAMLRDSRDPLNGMVTIGLGGVATILGLLLLALHERGIPITIGPPPIGAAMIFTGGGMVVLLTGGNLLAAVAGIGVGAAGIGARAPVWGPKVAVWVRGWWARLTGEPTPPKPTARRRTRRPVSDRIQVGPPAVTPAPSASGSESHGTRASTPAPGVGASPAPRRRTSPQARNRRHRRGRRTRRGR